MLLFYDLNNKQNDSIILPTSVTSKIIPASVVIAIMLPKGLKIINIPSIKCNNELISINDHTGKASDFKLKANWNFIINCIISHAPIIIPKNSFSIAGLNIKNIPITVYKVPSISSVLIALNSLFEVKYETI